MMMTSSHWLIAMTTFDDSSWTGFQAGASFPFIVSHQVTLYFSEKDFCIQHNYGDAQAEASTVPLPLEPATRALPHAMTSRQITHSSSSSKHHRSPALSSHPTPSPPARPTAHSHSRLGYYRQSIYKEADDHIKGKGSGSASVARGEGTNENKERGD
jgi:hypothetical protein